MATTPVPADIAAALRFGPDTQGALRRSKYLTAALTQMQQSGGQDIRSGGELAAKLLATALLNRGSKKADSAALSGVRQEQTSEAARLIAGLGGPQVQPPVAEPSPPPMAAAPAPPPIQSAPLAPAAGQPLSGGPIDPETDAMVRTVFGEAGGEDALGQQGVAAVIRNRSQERGMSVSDIVRQPKQFEPWGNPTTRARMESLSPTSPEYQAILRNIQPVLGGEIPAQFAGADHFYSPTAQQALGRAAPSWDNGRGADVGRHRFFDLEGGRPQPQVQAPPPQDPQPFQVAANGLQPGMIPSSPAASSPAAGGEGAPPAVSPQAAAGGAYYQPNPEEVAYAQRLLADPRTFEQGREFVLKLQQKMTQPPEYSVETINGMPFYVPKTPGQGSMRSIGVPDAAKTQLMTAQDAGLPYAQQGLNVQRDPLGNLKEAPGAPPANYNAGPNGYAPIRGSEADPYRTQAPSANYRYAGGGAQEAIPGSAADPRAPSNYIDQVGKLQNQIKPVVDDAIKLRRNIDAVRTGYAQQNGPGDIAMINGLQKLVDEGVVREGDVALQLKGQGIDGGIAGVKGFMTSQGFFADPKIRTAILNTANQLYGTLNGTYRERVYGFRGMTDRLLGPGSFEDVFSNDTAKSLGWVDGPGAGEDRSGKPEHWTGALPPAQLRAAQAFQGATGPGGTEANPFVPASPAEFEKLPVGAWFLNPKDGVMMRKGR